MHMVMTRTGYGPEIIPDPPRRVTLPIAWYAPKPAWMDYIEGPSLRFRHRIDFDRFMDRLTSTIGMR